MKAMNTHRPPHASRMTARTAAALAALPILFVASCGEERQTVTTAAQDSSAETATTTVAESTRESTTSTAAPSTTGSPGGTTSSTATPATSAPGTSLATVAPEATAAPTTGTTVAPASAPTVIATGPSISVEELPGAATARGAAPSEQVRLRLSGNFPMRSARLFVMIDDTVVGVGAPGASVSETIVDTTPRSAIVNGAKVSYRWESGPSTVVGALTLKG